MSSGKIYLAHKTQFFLGISIQDEAKVGGHSDWWALLLSLPFFNLYVVFQSLNIRLVSLKLNMKGYILYDFIFKILEVLQWKQINDC